MLACLVISVIPCCHSLQCYSCSYMLSGPDYDNGINTDDVACTDDYSRPQSHIYNCTQGEDTYCEKFKIAAKGLQVHGASRRCTSSCQDIPETDVMFGGVKVKVSQSCCITDLCNSASRRVISVGTLLCPLFIFVVNFNIATLYM